MLILKQRQKRVGQDKPSKTFKVSACVRPTNITLAKTNHMGKPNRVGKPPPMGVGKREQAFAEQ